MPPRKRAVVPRPALSKERLLRVAIELADRDGIEALSMRSLARELHTKPMSLYFYVAKKDDMLSGMLDIVVGEFALAEGGPDWASAVRRSLLSAHAALMSHPWACGLIMSAANSPARLRYMNALLKCLRDGGFSAEMTHHAFHVLDSHLIGFTLWQAGFTASRDLMDKARNFVSASPGQYAYVVEHAKQHFGAATRMAVPEFEFGLEFILDGLERIRKGAKKRTATKRRSSAES
jgi:AcrR family transcriptional regulator